MTFPSFEVPTVRAFLSLGSNLGDRQAHLRRAVDQLRAGSRPAVTAVSRVYETDPVGGPDDQGAFLNLVVELVRSVRWGPRTLDVDIIWIDGLALDDPDLTIPHPRWRERRFVLAPLSELAPDLVSDDDIEVAGGEARVVGMV